MPLFATSCCLDLVSLHESIESIGTRASSNKVIVMMPLPVVQDVLVVRIASLSPRSTIDQHNNQLKSMPFLRAALDLLMPWTMHCVDAA